MLYTKTDLSNHLKNECKFWGEKGPLITGEHCELCDKPFTHDECIKRMFSLTMAYSYILYKNQKPDHYVKNECDHAIIPCKYDKETVHGGTWKRFKQAHLDLAMDATLELKK